MASSVCFESTASTPFVRARRRHRARASRYFRSVSGPRFCARRKISWPNQGISCARSRSFHSIRAASDFTGADAPNDDRYAFSPALNS